MISPVEKIYADGGGFSGGEWTIDGLKVDSQTDALAQVSLAVTVAAGTTTPASGDQPQAYAESKHILRVSLTSVDQEWKFSRIELLS